MEEMKVAYNEGQSYIDVSTIQDQWEEGNLRKKMTVTTLNLSIEALVWKLKTFY